MTTIQLVFDYEGDDYYSKVNVEAARTRYGTTLDPKIATSAEEDYAIEFALDEAEGDEWDENKWQSNREYA